MTKDNVVLFAFALIVVLLVAWYKVRVSPLLGFRVTVGPAASTGNVTAVGPADGVSINILHAEPPSDNEIRTLLKNGGTTRQLPENRIGCKDWLGHNPAWYVAPEVHGEPAIRHRELAEIGCIEFRAGESVTVDAKSVRNGMIRARRQGEAIWYWTPYFSSQGDFEDPRLGELKRKAQRQAESFNGASDQRKK